MKRIVFHIAHGGGIDPFASLPEHTGGEPFIVLRERLAQAGYELAVDNRAPIEGSDWVFVLDIRGSDFPVSPGSALTRLKAAVRRALRGEAKRGVFYERCVKAGLAQRLVLMLWEPPAVLAENYDPRFHRLFSKILTWHDGLADGRRYLKFHFPQTGRFPRVPDVPYAERKLLANFSGNKVSRQPGELYSARKRTIRYFEARHPGSFDLYGPGWDAGGEAPFPSWRGTVPHKWELYPRYRFGLCYENQAGPPGWISEKIFDCMRAGCVPIYLGPPNAAAYLDPASYIDRSRFGSDADLDAFLCAMPESRWRQYRDAATAYLAGPGFAPFLPEAFAGVVKSAIGA